VINERLTLPTGYSINWSGQYEYMQRAKAKLTYVVPLTLMIIIILLFMNFRNLTDVAVIMGTLPLALVGGVWILYWLDYDFSIAVGVGLIALAGVAVEIGIIMLVYLKQSIAKLTPTGVASQSISSSALKQAVLDGAVKRVRPVFMTALATILGLLPIMLGEDTGSEVMQRLAAPMVGGMISALVLTLLVLPAIYYLVVRQVRH